MLMRCIGRIHPYQVTPWRLNLLYLESVHQLPLQFQLLLIPHSNFLLQQLLQYYHIRFIIYYWLMFIFSVNRLDPRYSSGVLSPGRHVRTRLYFTSESHIHSLLTILSEKHANFPYAGVKSALGYLFTTKLKIILKRMKLPSFEDKFTFKVL